MSDLHLHAEGLAAAIGSVMQALQLAGEAMVANDPSAAVLRIGELQVALVDAFAAAGDISVALLAASPEASGPPISAPGQPVVRH